MRFHSQWERGHQQKVKVNTSWWNKGVKVFILRIILQGGEGEFTLYIMLYFQAKSRTVRVDGVVLISFIYAMCTPETLLVWSRRNGKERPRIVALEVLLKTGQTYIAFSFLIAFLAC